MISHISTPPADKPEPEACVLRPHTGECQGQDLRTGTERAQDIKEYVDSWWAGPEAGAHAPPRVPSHPGPVRAPPPFCNLIPTPQRLSFQEPFSLSTCCVSGMALSTGRTVGNRSTPAHKSPVVREGSSPPLVALWDSPLGTITQQVLLKFRRLIQWPYVTRPECRGNPGVAWLGFLFPVS